MEKPIKQLFVDFITDRCTRQEIEQIQEFLRLGIYEPQWREAMEEVESIEKDVSLSAINEDRIFKKIQKSAGIQRNAVRRYTWLASAAALFFVLSAGVFFLKSPEIKKRASIAQVQKKAVPTIKKSQEHKWVKLPDGSSVQLNIDSYLDYPATFAGLKKREVTLTGEAYFDIKHDVLHPFVIHTGKIKTTVLGTAFNISAYKANIGVTVTVTRGKVKVEDEHKTLAVLTPDQQLVWNNSQPVVKAKVNAEHAIAWKKSDLIMDDITLEEAAKMITARYGVDVHFKNSKVKNCRFTAAFLNRNDVGQVLSVLGDITGATLSLKEGSVTIDGPGC